MYPRFCLLIAAQTNCETLRKQWAIRLSCGPHCAIPLLFWPSPFQLFSATAYSVTTAYLLSCFIGMLLAVSYTFLAGREDQDAEPTATSK